MKNLKKTILGIILLFILLISIICAYVVSSDIRKMPSGHAPAALINKNCATKYPIVIAHHWGPPSIRKRIRRETPLNIFARRSLTFSGVMALIFM